MIKIEDKNLVFPNIKYKHNVSLVNAKRNGDFASLSTILRQTNEWVISEIKNSGLRGRGGAGFSTGMKWSFMPKEVSAKPHYLVVNADESEPGTCKDREILTWEPFKLIQGVIFACKAISAKTSYIYVRGEYFKEINILQSAIDECYEDGILGGSGIDIFVHRGAGAYICGEESALLESLEGKRGMPRLKPPFPAQYGLYGCPTTINNVETIASVGAILTRGADWYKKFGRENNYGTKLFSISGNVVTPCVFEESMSCKMKDLINEYGGGVVGGWDNLLAVIPGGSSCPLLTKEMCEDVLMDYDSLKGAGSSFGTAGMIVVNKNNDIVDIICRLAYFYKHESCGQCTPCREGTKWIYESLVKIRDGKASRDEIERLFDLTKSMEGNTICALADAAAWPVQALIKNFKTEMLERCC